MLMATSYQQPHWYPILLDLAGRRCVVAGYGKVGQRKVRSLAECGASIVIVTGQAESDIADVPPAAEVVAGPYDATILTPDTAIVFACTSDHSVNARIADDCRQRNIWCNVADDPAAGTALLPASHRRGPLVVSVSTSGQAPALAGRIRDCLAEYLDAGYEQFVVCVNRIREQLKQRVADQEQRAEILRRLSGDDSFEMFRQQGERAWQEWAQAQMPD